MKTSNSYGILLGCFAINFFIAGAARLSSIFFVESITRYNVNRKQASFPFVLTYMLRHLSGPVVGYLEQIFGMRKIIVMGCAVATVSIGSCFFAEDILTVTIWWGIVLGLSFGCAHHMLPSILNSYFPGRESTANGISLSGACIGAIVLPIIMEMCIHNYGLSGSFLVLSAIISHTIPASLLIKNPKKDIQQSQPTDESTSFIDYDKNNHSTKFKHTDQDCIDKNNINMLENGQNQIRQNLALEASVEVAENKKHCIKSLNTMNREYDQNSCVSNGSDEDKKQWIKTKNTLNNISTDKTSELGCKRKLFSDKNMFSLQNFMIFADPVYIIILIIHCGGMALAVTVWTIILDFVRDKNVGEHLELYYVALLPLSDLVGRIGSGFVLDRNFLSKPNTTLVCFASTTFLFIAFVFTNNYLLLMLLEFFIAVFIGAIFLLQIVLIHQCMEVGKKTMAMTCRFVLYAPISLGISPMIGYFRGDNGSYDNVFYVLSGVSLFCGCSAYFIPYLKKRGNSEINMR
ncbi:monocarboxylate transporter 7-like isoform X1 [Parasteatoda tepidariorum]|uniref:monocarboxylate transporter 7-like isoform X1 n=1 Tax=Parasteatoda tepidariorum TaxID=114398 RepID=UPI001C722D6F|nr:uncharacterized protein LOC107448767 isoform X1 [Parasteatoda tepidariorum]